MTRDQRQGRHHKRVAERAPRRVVVRGVRREEVDVRRLGRAVIALAMAQAEADAQQEAMHTANTPTDGQVPNSEGVDDGD